MKLNITKTQSGGEFHNGPLFPDAEDRQCAYQNESIQAGMAIEMFIHGYPPRRGDGRENRDLPDSPYSRFTLVIERATGKALHFRLVGERKDTVEQRKATGAAVTEDFLCKTLSFGELVNRIFGDGAQVFHEREAFPESVRRAMMEAYPDHTPTSRPA